MTDSVRGFIVLRDFSAGIGLLSTLQKGQLMEALFADMEGTAMPELDPVANAVFQMMLPSVHAAQNAFSRRRETARENGAKGGRPRKDGGRPVPGQPHEQQAGQADAQADALPDAQRAGQPHGQPENRPVSGNRNRVDGKGQEENAPPPPAGGQGGDAASGKGSAGENAFPDVAFVQFLDAYPAHRRDEGASWQAWLSLSRARQLPGLPRLLDSVTAWEASEQWRKDNGQYVPLASSFLSKRRFIDAPPRSAAPAGTFDPERFARAAEQWKNRYGTGAA